MPITRRQLLKASIAGGAGLLLPPIRVPGTAAAATPLDPATLQKFTDALPLPGVLAPTSPGAYSLTLQQTAQQLHSSLPPTPLWGYNGLYPGPTIEAFSGEPITVTVTNALGAHLLPIDTAVHGASSADATHPRVSVHLHGGNVPVASDGGPEETIVPGSSYSYEYPNSQQSATLWYHDHALGITRLNVMAGLAGFYLLRDDAEAELGLPISLPYEVPIAIQDRTLQTDGRLAYPEAWMPEFFGDVAVVNGRAWPRLTVDRRLYRFRLLNGSNARIMKLGFDNGATFHLIASDAGLLDRPYPMTSLMLAPGERAEILVDFASVEVGGAMTLRTLPYDNAPDYRWQGWGMDAVRFDVTAASRASAVVPEQLIPLERLDPGATARTRFFQLAMVHQMPNMKHTINGREYDVERIDERVPAGAVEYWDFFNSSDEPHPMHLHGAQLQVAERDGAASSAPKDKGWKDVVLVEAQQTVRAAVRFSDHLGVFVAHCHNLEHEDTGMMINFVVESSTGVGSERSDGAALEPIWPNPALDLVNVAFTLRAPAQASIEIADTSGRIVIETSLGELDAGRHQTTVDLRGLASGAYVTTLDVGGMRSREKLTKVE